MKISFCSIAFRKEELPLPEIIPGVSGLGYDAIEIWVNHIKKPLLPRIKEALERVALPVSMISPYFDFTSSPQTSKRSLKHAEEVIGWADHLGAPLIRAFTGLTGSAKATGAQKKACVAALKETAAMAKDANITIALETHPATLTDNIEATLDLLAAVAAPNVKLNLDIYHFWEIYHDPLLVLEKLFPQVVHVHAKNARLSPEEQLEQPHPFLHDRQARQEFRGITYMEDGLMDYRPFLRELAARGFQGYISVEWFGDSVWDAARLELDFLRRELREVAPLPLADSHLGSVNPSLP